ncbi:MAG: hypothetical protein P4L53_04425 [Candidatus Obscuribacterales bacterium]|nr:hypothetical protein [Candidatus Obscuribacterales bacterium]
MSKAHTPAADAPKPDGLDTCLTTATTAAKDLLGDNNTCADATVKLTTSVMKDGKSQAATYQASVGLSKHVGELVDVPTAPTTDSGC